MTQAPFWGPRALLLAAVFAEIQRTRMVGLPMLNTRLQVQAVGFEPLPGDASVALGVLVTPWFMSLVCLPLQRDDTPAQCDERRRRRLGDSEFEFQSASEPALGRFECCSLFSPMFEFASQASAVATAECVLRELRPEAIRPVQQPARRAFLLGREGTRA